MFLILAFSAESFSTEQNAAIVRLRDKMPGFPNPRVRPARRHFVRHQPERRRCILPEDEVEKLLTTLADQFERGTALARNHAAGVFGPDDDDPWAPAGD